MITIRIPTVLRVRVGNQETVLAEGETVKQVLEHLEGQFPEVPICLRDEAGKLRRNINLYVNDEDIRFLSGEETPLKENDEISIIPAIVGG